MHYKCKLILLLTVILSTFSNCRNAGKKLKGREIVDNAKSLNEYVQQNIRAAMAIATDNNGQLDDTINLPYANVVEDFYYQRDYAPLWCDTGIFKSNTDALFSYLDTSIYDGLFKEDYHYEFINGIRTCMKSDSIKKKDAILWAKADVMLTDAFMHILGDLKQGRLIPDSIARKNDTSTYAHFFNAALNDFLSGKTASAVFDSIHPSLSAYRELRNAVPAFLKKMDTTRFTYLSFPFDFKNASDSLEYLEQVLKRLSESGKQFQPKNNQPDSAELASLIVSFQKKFKLNQDGKITKNLVRFLNNTDHQKLKRLCLSLDKYRMLPDSMPMRYIWVNLPSFYLKVIDSDSVKLTSRIVCGKPETKTPELKSAITDMVIYPTWTVPASIIKKEMLPGLKKNVKYLEKKGLTLYDNKGTVVDPTKVDWSKYKKGIPYQIRQGSGEDNALGVIKFNFFNPFDVYLHDTNQRGFFSRSNRALSHGCVRVQNWLDLAYFIADNDSANLKQGDSISYNRDSIDSWIAAKKKHRISVRNRIPVYLQYISCEVQGGKLVFFDDMYDEDKQLAEKYLAGK